MLPSILQSSPAFGSRAESTSAAIGRRTRARSSFVMTGAFAGTVASAVHVHVRALRTGGSKMRIVMGIGLSGSEGPGRRSAAARLRSACQLMPRKESARSKMRSASSRKRFLKNHAARREAERRTHACDGVNASASDTNIPIATANVSRIAGRDDSSPPTVGCSGTQGHTVQRVSGIGPAPRSVLADGRPRCKERDSGYAISCSGLRCCRGR